MISETSVATPGRAVVISTLPHMKLVRWVRFNWDLEKLPAMGEGLPAHYHFAPAKPENEADVREVISRSFAHDTAWGDAIHVVNGMLDSWMERVFGEAAGRGQCLTLRHGLRIIGATILLPDSLVEHHLEPGPCVLMEYRNRGLGTALLAQSLHLLREAGLTRASARAKQNSSVAKFLYPKFNGTPAPDDTPLLAA